MNKSLLVNFFIYILLSSQAGRSISAVAVAPTSVLAAVEVEALVSSVAVAVAESAAV